MTRTIIGPVLAIVVCCGAYGQAADPMPSFEVASVKPAPKPTGTGGRVTGCFRGTGPGSTDPGLYTCSNATVSLMAFQAYGLKSYQFPSLSADTAEFNVAAKVPPDATAEQIKLMLRSLLAERFKLAFHYGKKEMPVYDLVVAKGGVKMQESLPESAGAAPPPFVPDHKMAKDTDGFPIYPAPRGQMRMFHANGLGRLVGRDMPIAALVNFLTNQVGRPVIDSTGLKAKYDLTVTFTLESLAVAGTAVTEPSPSEAGGLTIFAALEKQLGLKLEQAKSMIDVFVIDHAEKAPIEN